MKDQQSDYPVSNALCDWYSTHKRPLPWRETDDPYRIWLSEVILQQTRIAQGLAYYRDFTETFPDVRALAEASEETVLRHWQGLGYYSRARNLHLTAREIAGRFNGVFPHTYKELLELKGIGPYTAAAIASFAFGAPVAVLDGNVYRVLARLFDIDTDLRSPKAPALFRELSSAVMAPSRSAVHNQAIMDFGATLCTEHKPECEACPLQAQCLAFARGTVGARPVRSAAPAKTERFFHYLFLFDRNGCCLHRREGNDIWRHLWEFPLVETSAAAAPDGLSGLFPWLGPCPPEAVTWHLPVSRRHVLTHRVLHIDFCPAEAGNLPALMANTDLPAEGFKYVSFEESEQYGLPKPLVAFLGRFRNVK